MLKLTATRAADGSNSGGCGMQIQLFGGEFTLLHRFRSKKNRVYLVENSNGRFLLKLYRPPHHRRSAAEHGVLQEAYRRGAAVPQPLAFSEERALLMEYIAGENLCDLLNRRCRPVYADMLAEWFACFHRCFSRPGGTTLLRGDANLRNFVVSRRGALYGIDFEEAAPGRPEQDLGQICASILDTEPMFTPAKAVLCRRLIVRYGQMAGRENPEHSLAGPIAAALRESARRRPQQRRHLLREAGRLERKGLAIYLS